MTITELAAAMAAKETPITITEPALLDLVFGLSTHFNQNSLRSMASGALTGMFVSGPSAASASMPYMQSKQVEDIEKQLQKTKRFPIGLTLTENHLPIGTHFTQDIDQVRAILAAAPEYLITLVSAHQIVLDRK
ncbi:hypothetical protein [Schleiferilactobacillus harbinensis]|uniref:Uncharacterized protein n=1 Tax=Schleiferilactobacillus harbinensis TaxID=304207 RepID=A0A5P8M1L5_9LACO|nr:hypothetical protein [Schleiferilactobacillus harbinensis]QFR22174.1 hypothetical protein D1010_01210 [Schleiferilactobacillus harbinensis]